MLIETSVQYFFYIVLQVRNGRGRGDSLGRNRQWEGRSGFGKTGDIFQLEEDLAPKQGDARYIAQQSIGERNRTTSRDWTQNDEREFTALLEKELDKIHDFQKTKSFTSPDEWFANFNGADKPGANERPKGDGSTT
ncbi:hypothetical protein PHLCEN_2v5790 [Hermanssonia centrifuga]|uniref:Uncharacterized protein n=1 Tax=Hermanssonia centrifuga TaxID=98765 RepID=A0A2R6P1F6_9APHY|nr:hypothetical protein PHLCEN_2v5790 [Hermanssonia centrifuga]